MECQFHSFPQYGNRRLVMKENILNTYSIFRQVAQDYIYLIDVDLKTEKEVQIALQEDHTLPKWSQEDDYRTSIVGYANLLIVDEDRNRFIECTRLDVLKDILSREKEYIIEYDTFVDESRRHFQGRFILNEDKSHMLIGIRDITETKKYEVQSREIAEYERHKSLLQMGRGDKRTILIIDDSELNRDILKDLLSDDYNILEAENGKIGLDILQEEHSIISLILLDVTMPVMNGYEFLEEMKKNPVSEMIPVIVMTGLNDQGQEAKCLQMGASDFITKPYNADVVMSRVNSMIRLRESVATLAQVEFDELTGLYTKEAFCHYADMLLSQYPEKKYACLVSDIEDFRSINEHYGTKMADELLVYLADYLKGAEKDDVLVGRLVGDQFVALLEMDVCDQYMPILEENTQALKNGMGHIIFNLKYGLYENVDHQLSMTSICDRAILALRTVKHQFGKILGRYTLEIQEKENVIRQIESSMQTAFYQNQFKVYYQPKHNALTGELIGAEALIRWIHPEFGFMSPGDFIPLFEKNGFISWADYYVWKNTCQNIKKWKEKGLSVVPVSVNASRLDFNHDEFMRLIQNCLEENGISSDMMHIEVTESVFAENIDVIVQTLNQCRELGIKIELDDFGSGYSSLNALSDLPVDIVKLDMSFMRQIQNPKKTSILSGCINLCKALRLETIVEGVETVEQLDIVRRFGADAIQGYYFSKPLPEEEFEEYLKKCMTMSNSLEAIEENNDLIVDELMMQTSSGFVVCDIKGRHVIHASPEACDIWGCDSVKELKEFCQESFDHLIYREDVERINHSIYKQIIKNPSHGVQSRYRIMTKDGTVKWVDANTYYVHHDIYGELFYCFISDVPKN